MSVAVCSREARAPRPRRIFQAGARLGLAALVGVAVASIDVPARAETSAEVNVIFKRGVEAYKEADFRAAAAEFRRAYEASKHDYRVLYNIAQCEYQLTNYVGALAAFERFLADGGGKVKDDKRGEVAGEIAKLKARIATITVQLTPATAQLSIDGEAAKADEPIKLNPGGHKLEATAPGFQRGLAQVDVTGGDARTVTLALVAVPPPKPVVVVAPPRSRRARCRGQRRSSATRSPAGSRPARSCSRCSPRGRPPTSPTRRGSPRPIRRGSSRSTAASAPPPS